MAAPPIRHYFPLYYKYGLCFLPNIFLHFHPTPIQLKFPFTAVLKITSRKNQSQKPTAGEMSFPAKNSMLSAPIHRLGHSLSLKVSRGLPEAQAPSSFRTQRASSRQLAGFSLLVKMISKRGSIYINALKDRPQPLLNHPLRSWIC